MTPSELGTGEYLEGVTGVLVVAISMAASAVWLRGSLIPGWSGAPARLAESVLAIALLTGLSLLLGTFGILAVTPLVAASLVVALAVERWSRRPAGAGIRAPSAGVPGQGSSARDPGEETSTADPGAGLAAVPPRVRAPRGASIAAVAVATLAFALWGLATSWSVDEGITNFDSVWYHLPFAAEIAQSGSTLGLHRVETVSLNWLYPQGSELLHAVGMVLTGRDAVSLGLNLGWLGLALLAAWCIGRPYGRGHLTIAAAAILLTSHNLVAREPGTAKNDIAAIALVLAAAALWLNARPTRRAASGVAGGDVPGGVAAGPGAPRPGAAWPVVIAALAGGLAVGVKVTAIAPVMALAVAAIALAPAGRRHLMAAWWGAGLVAGGGYWYVRNLVVAGNPLPQVTQIGPLQLPGPESLQTGRPDFTVAHYLTDTGVWFEYFTPGLARGFGALWPLVLLLALGGAVWLVASLARRLSAGLSLPAASALGVAALVGMVAYLVTPLGAAGAEGEPTAFAINLRFAIPSLALGIVAAAIVVPATREWHSWAAFASFVVVGGATNGVDRIVLGSGGRLFGWGIAMVAVVIPSLLVLAWRYAGRHPATASRRRAISLGVVGAACLLAAGLLLAGLSLQRSYLETRYADFEPDLGMAGPYRWASGTSGASIGLAGTTAGFHGYGFYGPDLGNSVQYLGREAPTGGYHPIPTCSGFREAVNRADLDYLVTSPFFNFLNPQQPVDSPERRWVAEDPAVTPMLDGSSPGQPVTVWLVDGELDPDGCSSAEQPLREVPHTPSS